MKIKITQTLPIAKQHGAVEGAIFDLVKTDEVKDLHYFIGNTGQECAAYSHECELVEDDVEAEIIKTHVWEKINNVTEWEGKRSLDRYKCKYCKAKAKMYMIGVMEQDKRFSEYCKGQN